MFFTRVLCLIALPLFLWLILQNLYQYVKSNQIYLIGDLSFKCVLVCLQSCAWILYELWKYCSIKVCHFWPVPRTRLASRDFVAESPEKVYSRKFKLHDIYGVHKGRRSASNTIAPSFVLASASINDTKGERETSAPPCEQKYRHYSSSQRLHRNICLTEIPLCGIFSCQFMCAVKRCGSDWPPVIPTLPASLFFLDSALRFPAGVQLGEMIALASPAPSLPL